MESGSVIGFNSPSAVAGANGYTFLPAGGGIVTIDSNGCSALWEPTDGLYQIDKIAVSGDGSVLCFSEKRLAVSLHIYSLPSLKSLDEVADVASAEVDQIHFSSDGNLLFVLCSIPVNCVKVMSRSNGRFTGTCTVALPEGNYTSLFNTCLAEGCGGFVVVGDSGCLVYKNTAPSKYTECFNMDINGKLPLCGASFADGIIAGTSTGGVVHYMQCDPRSMRTILSTEGGEAVTAVAVIDDRCYAGTESGDLYAINQQLEADKVSFSVGDRVRHMISCAPGHDGTLMIGGEDGVYMYETSSNEGILLPIKRRVAGVSKCFLLIDGRLLVASVDGSFAVFSPNGVEQWKASIPMEIRDCALVTDHALALLCADGTVCIYDIINGKQVLSMRCGAAIPTMCQSNGRGKFVLCDYQTVYFFSYRERLCACHGVTYAHGGSPITVVRWLDEEEDLFFVSCRNGELYLLIFPKECASLETEHSVDEVVESMWRLDMPIVELLPCFRDGAIVHILVHSIDKDTKLYALERRREGDKKAIRPLFLMRDHDSGGSCLMRLDTTTVLSGGKDGRIVARNIAHYQVKISPIPPSKEKRKPVFSRTARPFCDGGVAAMALWDGKAVVGGKDGVLMVLPVTAAATAEQLVWLEGVWTQRRVWGQRESVCDSGDGDTMEQYQGVAEGLTEKLEELRKDWKTLMVEKDDDVPVEALLLPNEQVKFATECDEAISAMRESEYYHGLMNEYVQDTIKKRCVDAMEVNRCKVVCLAEKGVEVHNFHLLKETCAGRPLFRKAHFMRRLQIKASMGFTFSGLREESLARKGSHNSELATELEPIASLFHSPYDVYTHSRTVLQALLFRSAVFAVKESFNRRFSELRERKRSTVSQIEERTQRCVKIMRQLGEAPGELFSICVDKEEDPNTLFNVYDDELDEEVRKLIVHDSEVRVFSLSNEAALKQWMDGLEKDVELLEVKMSPPGFADETRGADVFVPPDERTEEQVRQMEEYEKRLAEETEHINTRKEALRNEFRTLQKDNRAAATAVDEELKKLRWLRLDTAETVDESELQLVRLHQHLLRTPVILHKDTTLSKRIESLQRDLDHTSTLLQLRRAAAEAALLHLDELAEASEAFVLQVRNSPPFTNAAHGDKLLRRFTRWKNRYDNGKAPMPSVEKPADECPAELWALYCEHCECVGDMKKETALADEHQRCKMEEVGLVEDECDALRKAIVQANEERDGLKRDYVASLLNTDTLYRVRHGQIQDERATVTSDFTASCMRWVKDADRYNKLIFSSDQENAQLLRKTVQRQKKMKLLQWETERLQYCVGTLQMELQQLHTLRITRQMQEWLSGDTEMTEEKTISMIEKHMSCVSENMNRKIDDLATVAMRLRCQIAERATENGIIEAQCQQLSSMVQDTMTVKGLVDVHADGSLHFINRSKEIFMTSELEELARSQQEDLLRLKKEVDRLRERTFPSFAVVSKRTV